MDNIFTLNNISVCEYYYEFIRRPNKTKRGDTIGKLIDIIIFNTGLDYFLERANFVANEFYWNGFEWYIPVTSIVSFLTYKIMPIKKLSSVGLLQIYEPWIIAHGMDEINNIVKPACISLRNNLVRLGQTNFLQLIDHDNNSENSSYVNLNKILNNVCNENSPDDSPDDKILSWIDIYRLMKTLYRVYKYINRGYQFPNLDLFLADIYKSSPTENDYQQQIITSAKITLDDGHTIAIKDHGENAWENAW